MKSMKRTFVVNLEAEAQEEIVVRAKSKKEAKEKALYDHGLAELEIKVVSIKPLREKTLNPQGWELPPPAAQPATLPAKEGKP